METTTVYETINLEEIAANDEGVIVNVPILGAKSRNKRIYTTEAMQGGVELYNEAAIYVDHARGSRKSEDKFGVIKNARFDEEASQIRGDLYLLKSHPLYSRVQEDTQRGLNLFGLSHSADVWSKKNNDGIFEVSKIEKVNSVDLVSSPATLKSLTESEEHRADYLETVKEEATVLINTVISEAAETLSSLIKEKLEAVLEEVTKERLAKLGDNPYSQLTKVEDKVINTFELPSDKGDKRSFLLTL